MQARRTKCEPGITQREPDGADNPSEREPVQADKREPDRG